MRTLKSLIFISLVVFFVSTAFAENFVITTAMKKELLCYKPNKYTSIQAVGYTPIPYHSQKFAKIIYFVPVATRTDTTFVTENRIDFAVFYKKRDGKWKLLEVWAEKDVLNEVSLNSIERDELQELLRASSHVGTD